MTTAIECDLVTPALRVIGPEDIMTPEDAWRELLELLAGVPDPRAKRGKRHLLGELLFVAIIALIGGSQDAEAIHRFGLGRLDWFRRFVRLKNGVPSHDTFLKVFALLSPDGVKALLASWVARVAQPEGAPLLGQQVAIDGQTLRGSIVAGSGLAGVHIVSAWLVEAGVTIGVERVDDKSNEIPAIPELIKELDLRGTTVTMDAMGTQREIASAIRAADAHYIMQVKGNQPALREAVKSEMHQATRRRQAGEGPSLVQRTKDVDKGHGRVETRSTAILLDPSRLPMRDQWADVAGMAAVARERENLRSGKVSQDLSLYIFSDPTMTAERLHAMVRHHWSVESGLHDSMDVVWGSDGHRVCQRRAAENLAILRRLCANMVRGSVGWGIHPRGIRQLAGWDPDVALAVLRGEKVSMQRKRSPNRKDRDAKRSKRGGASKAGAPDEAGPARLAGRSDPP